MNAKRDRQQQRPSALIRAPRLRAEPVRVPTAGGSRRPVADAAAVAAAELAAQLEQAYARGVADGRAAVAEAAAQQAAAATAALGAATDAFVAERERLCMNAEVMIRELAVEIAAHVMRGEVHSGRPIALHLAQEAVSRLKNANELEVHVHPADADLVRGQQAALAAAAPGGTVTVVADPTIEHGGCRVEGAGMVVDAELRSGLAVIADEFGVELGESPSAGRAAPPLPAADAEERSAA